METEQRPGDGLMINKHRLKGFDMKNSQAGTRWITDGVTNKKVKPNEVIPAGWEIGRKNVHSEEMRAALIEYGRRSDPEKRKKTMLKKYGALSTETQALARAAYWKEEMSKRDSLPFSQKSYSSKRRHIAVEQDNKCLHCELDTWLDKPIKLELDHVDGNKKHNSRENLRLICPNCHSFTETWRKKKTPL